MATPRGDISEDALAVYQVPLSAFKALDGAALGVAEDSADLFMEISSNVWTLLGRTPESAAEAASADFQFALPIEYSPQGDVQFVVEVQFINASGADAGRASRIDCLAFRQAAGAAGSDIGATAAQAPTTDDTYETFTFTITATTLGPGDVLNVRLTLTCTADDGNPTQLQASNPRMLLDVRG